MAVLFLFILFKVATRTFKITHMILILLLDNNVLDRTNLSEEFKACISLCIL